MLMSESSPSEFWANLTLADVVRSIAAAWPKLRPSPLDLVFVRTISGCVHTGPVYVAGTNIRVPAEWFRVVWCSRNPTAAG